MDEFIGVGRIGQPHDIIVLPLTDTSEVEERRSAVVDEQGIVKLDGSLLLNQGVQTEQPVCVVAIFGGILGLVSGIEGREGEVIQRCF